MINELHELRDLLDEIERDGDDFDQGAMNAAFDIVERLILQHEPTLPTPAVGLCYSVKTPFSPASAPPPPKPKKKSRRPAQQCPTLGRKRKSERKSA